MKRLLMLLAALMILFCHDDVLAWQRGQPNNTGGGGFRGGGFNGGYQGGGFQGGFNRPSYSPQVARPAVSAPYYPSTPAQMPAQTYRPSSPPIVNRPSGGFN